MDVDGPQTPCCPTQKRRPSGTHSNPDIGATMIQNAHITGQVAYREGDGPNITIRLGPCEVQETELDATISWSDGDSHGSAAMPIADYRRYVASKAIQIDGPKTMPAPPPISEIATK
jgi:hypothetical protein